MEGRAVVEEPPSAHDGATARTGQEEFLAAIADSIAARGLNLPARLLLEMNKPLTGLFYNISLVSAPLVFALFGMQFQKNLENLLESAENVEQLIQMIEEREKRPA